MKTQTARIATLIVLVVGLIHVACGQAPTQPPTTSPPTRAAPTLELTLNETAPVSSEEPQERTFEIIGAESEASYTVTVDEEFFAGAVQNLGKQLGFFTSVGATQAISGQITLILGDQPRLIGGEFVVDISTLKSDDRRRDERILEQFLRSRLFPLAVFQPLAIEGLAGPYIDGEQVEFQMIGEMTIREVTRPVTFAVSASVTDGVLEGSARTMILMTDFDFDPPEIAGFMKAEDQVLINVVFVAVELK